MSLKEAAGWNQTEGDWVRLLSLRPGGCFVAEWEGRPAGTVTTIDYGGLGWIGMLLVSADARRRGIGSELLRAALESLTETPTARLDATPLGEGLYERHGFEAEAVIERLARPAATLPDATPTPADVSIRPLEAADLPAAAEIDADAFGAHRDRLLAAWHEALPPRALAAERGGRLRGFVLARPGSRADHIGPLVAEGPEVARALLAGVLARSGGGAILDVPASDASWIRFAESSGFRRERRLTRMRRGPLRLARVPGLLWATAGPEVG
jgi:ribosomal protein S18 acetylase RimI-like enzyme